MCHILELYAGYKEHIYDIVSCQTRDLSGLDGGYNWFLTEQAQSLFHLTSIALTAVRLS